MLSLCLALQMAVKPNVIYIMVDDLGYGELGCYGQKKILTPNVDRLAAEGMKFTQFYAPSPVCAPTRCSLLTGKHQGHAAIRGNKETGGFGPNDPEGQFPLPKSETTIAEVLKKSGYRTGIVGKWGLGGPDPGDTPMDHGFDFFYGFLCQRRAHNSFPPYLWKNHQPDLLGNPIYNAHQKATSVPEDLEEYNKLYGGKTYAGTKFLENCIDFIKSSKGKPFFLYFAPTAPHVALQAPVDWIEKYPKSWDPKPYLGEKGYLPTPRPRATYAAMISYLDFTVGEIRKELEKDGLDKNTLIIFTSDNGATFAGGVDRDFFQSNGVYRDGKMSLYEGGYREPFIAWYPSMIRPGTQCDVPFAGYDSLVSIADFCGAKAPRTDGVSYVPEFTGQAAKKREYLYFEYPEANSMRAVVFGRMKAIQPNLIKKPDLIEVYDLVADPSETYDLAASRPDIVKRAKEVFAKEHIPNKDFPLPGVDH
ncbi:MAG: sulfatase-like hydrolase/transferase [Armatimonadetes bacterium]|nr:sulfatase-like hydrolase/transferase [Armatimonadota bacterium]